MTHPLAFSPEFGKLAPEYFPSVTDTYCPSLSVVCLLTPYSDFRPPLADLGIGEMDRSWILSRIQNLLNPTVLPNRI